MSQTKFSIRLGLYDAEFNRTPVNDSLLIARLGGESQEEAWQRLSTDHTYDPCRSKATSFRSLALMYIYFLLSHTVTGRRDSTGVISQCDFDCLLSMANGFHMPLRYEVAVSIAHQGSDP